MVPGVARRWRGEAAGQRGGGEVSLHSASVVRCRPFVRWRRRMAAPSSKAPSAVGAKYKYEPQMVREASVPYPFYPAFGSAYLLLARCLVAQAPVAATSLVRDTRVEGLSVPGAYPSLHSLSQSIKPGEARPSNATN